MCLRNNFLGTRTFSKLNDLDLQDAISRYDAREITLEQLQATQDKAARDSVERLEQTGHSVVTDGEQRA